MKVLFIINIGLN